MRDQAHLGYRNQGLGFRVSELEISGSLFYRIAFRLGRDKLVYYGLY
jgi:hypothetical protein